MKENLAANPYKFTRIHTYPRGFAVKRHKPYLYIAISSRQFNAILNRIFALFFTCALATAQTTQTTQQQDPEQDAVIRVSVDLVQVDAVVTDSNGNAVMDLNAEDFVILQDGKPQKITNFAFIKTIDSTSQPMPEVHSHAQPADAPPVPLPPLIPLEPKQVRRTIALVVDDMGLSIESAARIREACRKWIYNEMQPYDLVAVILTGGAVGALQQFTNDKRILYTAIERIRVNASSRLDQPMRGPITQAAFLRPADVGEEFNLLSTMLSLGSIRNIVDGMRDLPGRKSLILFTESLNMRFDAGSGQSQGREMQLQITLQNLLNVAHRHAVVIHSIDPRGVVDTGFTAQDNPWLDQDTFNALTPSDISATFSYKTNMLMDSQDGMHVLAKQTGGLFIQNRNDIDRALHIVAEDGAGYYLLGYQPDAKTVEEMTSGKTRIHRIKVRVKRPGLRVRSRSRFFTTPQPQSAADPPTQWERIQEALHSPFTKAMLPVRLTTLFFNNREEGSYINVLLHFDTRSFAFSEGLEGQKEASIALAAALFGADGQPVEVIQRNGLFLVESRILESIRKNGIAFQMHIPVKAAGLYQMRVVLCDTKSGQLGSAMQVVEVPDIRKGRLALSGIVVAADEIQPKDINLTEGVAGYGESNGTPAVRIFKPGDTIIWSCQVLNAKSDDQNKPKLQVYTRLFYDGQEVYSDNPSVMTTQTEGDSKRMILTGRLHLKRALTGNYALQVIALDTLAKKKHQMAVQSTDFEVQYPQQSLLDGALP